MCRGVSLAWHFVLAHWLTGSLAHGLYLDMRAAIGNNAN